LPAAIVTGQVTDEEHTQEPFMVRWRFWILTLTVLSATVVLGGATVEPGAFAQKKEPEPQGATPASELQTLPGYKVELIHSADAKTEGSWINMAKDNKGRLLIAGQRGQPILRVTLKDGKVDKIDKLDLPISEAMGMLYAFDSLYVNGAGPKGVFGLYRCKDTKGSDQYDDVKLLKELHGSGEHGPHAVVLGPDKMIYVINGNHTRLPEGLADDSPHKNYQEDQLLPRQWDAGGHAVGILAPGGHVLRTDPEGSKWQLVLAGFRNAYDMAFNADGELFTFDSDMEWDWGMPWYRPIRINHCTSGAEFGWRSGSGKWPDYSADSLGAVVNVGIGSPTGVVFGKGAKFPAKYQKALYVLDWTYGRVIALHLTPKGSSYTATFENLVAPKYLKGQGKKVNLNLTDVVIGDDGAMYFTTGGRNTQSGLYRVSYIGDDSTAPANLHDEAGTKERQLRHEIEALHGKKDPKTVDAVWQHLNSDDRNIRYAARIAVEWQPVSEWKERALAEKQPTAALTALLALARCGTKESQHDLLVALEKFPLDKLTEEQQLAKLRILEVSLARQGLPIITPASKIIAELDPYFPNKSERLNRELVQLLIYLEAPHVVEKSLKLMVNAGTREDRLHYLFHLRTLPSKNWTMEQRKEYFAYYAKDSLKLPPSADLTRWFADTSQPYTNGVSFNGFMRNFFKEATGNLSAAERKELAALLESIDKESVTNYDVKPRPVVKEWKMEDIQPKLDGVNKGRNYQKGKEAYLVGQCIKCHRFDNEGGASGPDLTGVSSRFSRRDILESILEPSKVVSDQYRNIIVTTKGGKTIVGRLMDETKEKLVIQPTPLSPELITIKVSDVDSRDISKLSPMPDHLVDGLTAEEILDLIAYLESGGRKDYKAFRP
jgi:putative heme-binding domain-containing protein